MTNILARHPGKSELRPPCNPNAATGAFHQPYTLGDTAKKCFRI